MFNKRWIAFKSELQNYTRSEKLFILFALLCGFFISNEYAITRPVSNALFISALGAKWLPYAWIAGIPCSLLVVSLYNRLLTSWGCTRLFLLIASIVVFANLSGALLLPHYPNLAFVHYVWKEIYVMLMFQQLWSVVHATVDRKRVKYLYGFLFAFGTLGAACGSLMPSFFAVKMGSENLLFLTLPIYTLLTACFFQMCRYKGGEITFKEKPSLYDGLKSIVNSRYLSLILLLVVLMQITSTTIDFQFSQFLEREIPLKDYRTAYFGKVMSIVQLSALAMQAVGAYLLIRVMGFARSHLFVPLVLMGNAIVVLLYPVFGVITIAFATIKSFDFSLFTVIKEMLYVPLSIDAKFHGKAFIDIFAYRSSKALGSLLIFCLPAYLGWVNLALFLIWTGAVLLFLRKEYKTLQEMHA